jgi:hypothetical protein
MIAIPFATCAHGGVFVKADDHGKAIDELIVRMAHQLRRGRVDPEARAQNLNTLFTALSRDAAISATAAPSSSLLRDRPSAPAGSFLLCVPAANNPGATGLPAHLSSTDPRRGGRRSSSPASWQYPEPR